MTCAVCLARDKKQIKKLLLFYQFTSSQKGTFPRCCIIERKLMKKEQYRNKRDTNPLKNIIVGKEMRRFQAFNYGRHECVLNIYILSTISIQGEKKHRITAYLMAMSKNESY